MGVSASIRVTNEYGCYCNKCQMAYLRNKSFISRKFQFIILDKFCLVTKLHFTSNETKNPGSYRFTDNNDKTTTQVI